MTKFILFVLCLVPAFSTRAQMKSVKLADLPDPGLAPVGVSSAVNQRNPKNIVVGAGKNRLLISIDGGKTWQESEMKSPLGVAGNPVMLSDSKGNLHYVHLSDPGSKGQDSEGWMDRIVCQTSIDDGANWSEGSSAGNNAPGDNANPRITSHYTHGDLYLTWTKYDKYGSNDSTCQANVFFSKSSHGKRWSDPVQINRIAGDCKHNDKTPIGAMAVVNTNERIFAVWANRDNIYFDRSYDNGDTWLSNDLPIVHQNGGSFMTIPGLGSCSGMPTLVADNSETFFRGSLYVCYADQTNGENDTDIWLIRSINRGDSWSKPQRINQDGAGKHQFMPMMTVDQETGVVYIIYYDRRAHIDQQTDVYLAYSVDGSSHFSETKISETSFRPEDGKPFAEYIGISAHKGVIAPVWMRMDNGKLSIWTTVIRQEDVIRKEDLPRKQQIVRPQRRY